ncbi:MAG: LptF/LptG family permease [Sphingobium sp.]|uniref:LptF/LptG family permease n=1 Tax=Sphingobium sp. JS3065 TaxID=2970925 RepID=UPI002264E063|nr:LptF/LptG family permease [Sphingobium sp. JS3065]MCH4152462.1 LptF/LptG family permease [Sphingobium sp.]MCI1271914.1 LptF/LptG family permease [Sphingobium sp.]MCI1754429.1 LptF/LptG family permease [Sphingobium sp.]MCI2053733.1 LptF/LptG family permease [Sphingobium sp.]UZW56751.1 LptF/LptG family permease [Sphingobium sp. JS3065]
MASAIPSYGETLQQPRLVEQGILDGPLPLDKLIRADPKARPRRSILSHRRILLIDRYIASGIIAPFAATVAIIVMLLTLENVPRLIKAMVDVYDPINLLGRYVVALLPEYLGFGLLVALYLSVALALRRLALQGELEIFAAAGFSNAAILKVPIITAFCVAVLIFGIRGYAQPWGERQLDSLGTEIQSGDHGLRIRPGTVVHLAKDVALSVDRMGIAPNTFSGVFVQTGTTTVAAAFATAQFDSDHRLRLILEDGTFVRWNRGSWSGSGQFARLELPLPLGAALPPRISPREQLDRVRIDTLLAMTRGEPRVSTGSPNGAIAALAARIAGMCFCFIVPFLAFALAIPPKRSRSAIGLGVGLVLLVVFIRMSAAVEAVYASNAISFFALLLAGWAVAAWLLMRITTAGGLGVIESHLIKCISRPIASLGRRYR